jgi:hypothetical protein
MKSSLRYILATLLLAGIVLLITITYMNYKVIPEEVYKLDKENLFNNGGFENFNSEVGDCCNANGGSPLIYASRSKDAYEGDYSLNLTSNNHCACITESVEKINPSFKYLFSFDYKGDKIKICNLVLKDNICNPYLTIDKTEKWTIYRNILILTNKSNQMSTVFYAESSGESVTNLYDDLQVHKLILITPSLSPDDYKQGQEYVIKTNPTNVISSICAKQYKDSEGNCPVEKLSDDGYYLVRGAPQVNLKFPWTELVLIVIMMLIVIRLLFRKEVIKVEETFEYELKKGLKKFR